MGKNKERTQDIVEMEKTRTKLSEREWEHLKVALVGERFIITEELEAADKRFEFASDEWVGRK